MAKKQKRKPRRKREFGIEWTFARRDRDAKKALTADSERPDELEGAVSSTPACHRGGHIKGMPD